MAEERRGLPVGLIIAAPPVLAALYLGLYMLADLVLDWPVPAVLEVPLEWFVEVPVDFVLKAWGSSWDALPSVSVAHGVLIFSALWLGSFLLVGLLLGALAALVNEIVARGGTGAQEG